MCTMGFPMFVGYCKECGSIVCDIDEIEGYKDIYECPSCNHPHAKNELWNTLPDYLKK